MTLVQSDRLKASTAHPGVFIAWKKFQRRVEVLAPYFSLEIHYIHFRWEEKSKVHKAFSYLLKSLYTLKILFQKRPPLVFIQLPPIFALYCTAFYGWLTGAKYVTDCHNSMVYRPWYRWPLAKQMLRNGVMLVHNAHVAQYVKQNIGLSPFVLRTGITQKRRTDLPPGDLLKRFGLAPQQYVILPWNINTDEPLEETFEAMRMLPDTRFVMTWYPEKLPKSLSLPPNLLLTGFLSVSDFNPLFANAGVALVLTTRDGTQLSGVHEAMAFEIPMVVSDLKTTRFLYRDAPVFVDNTASAIAEGIRCAFEMRPTLIERIKILRVDTENEFSQQVSQLKALIHFQGEANDP